MSYRALIVLASALTLSAGCLDNFAAGSDGGDQTGGGGNGGGGGGADAAMAAPDVLQDFNTKVNPILDKECGACHNKAGGIGPGFLEPKPDVLTTLLSYPGLIGAAPETSRIYAKGTHEGPAFLDAERMTVGDWIVEYNKYKPAPTDGGVSKPFIQPVKPMLGQVNTIDLSVLDVALKGVYITFTPNVVGTSLELSKITVKTPASTGVHVAHPLFVLWDAQFNATPDPVDSFSNLDETVSAGASVALGPGTLLLPNYTNQMLNVVFNTLEAKVVMGDGGTGTTAGQCKNLTVFSQQVKPLLQANCNTCHVGTTPTAGLSFDFGRNTDAEVCANALTEVNLTTPASSLLLSKPNPAVNDGHPRKITNYTAWQTAVTNWINGEK